MIILWYMSNSNKDNGMQIPIYKDQKINEAVHFSKQNHFYDLFSWSSTDNFTKLDLKYNNNHTAWKCG